MYAGVLSQMYFVLSEATGPDGHFKFRYLLLLLLSLWTLAFVVLIVPLTALHAWKVGKRPIVTGYFTDYRVLPGYHGKPTLFASLDFDRPASDGLEHCHVETFYMGDPAYRSLYVASSEFAVRSDSCGEYSRLPLSVPNSLADWISLYLLGCVGSLFYGVLIRYIPTRKRLRLSK